MPMELVRTQANCGFSLWSMFKSEMDNGGGGVWGGVSRERRVGEMGVTALLACLSQKR